MQIVEKKKLFPNIFLPILCSVYIGKATLEQHKSDYSPHIRTHAISQAHSFRWNIPTMQLKS